MVSNEVKKGAKRAPTQSAKRKKKAMHRSRKQARRKAVDTKPSWVRQIKTKYEKTELEAKRKRADGEDEDDDDGTEGFLKGEKEGAEVQDEVSEEKQERMNKAQPLETQLFLRGVPSEITQYQIERYFTQFGKVKRVMMVKNRVTQRAAGSVFVHFATVQQAEAAYEHAQQNAREVSAAARQDFQAQTQSLTHHQAKRKAYQVKKNPHENTDPFVTIGESRIVVHRVLSRIDSQEATSAMIKKKKRTRVAADDPRNLYLLHEGMINRESPAAEGLPERYILALERDYETRKEQLKNINMFVSKVRLSLRNIPRKESADSVRKVIIKECKAYFRKHPEDCDKDQWGKHGPVKNLKIVLDGNGQSKGFGFVELASHGAALHVLRRLNNNPTLYGPNQRLIVSFSVENMNAIKKLQQLREQRRTKQVRTRGTDYEEE